MRRTVKACLFCIILIASLQVPSLSQQPDFKNLSRLQKHLLKQIAKYGKVESKNIGAHAVYSEQYARFDSLVRISSATDLMLFTSYPSASVKIYVFQKLVDKQNIDQALQVLQYNLQDTTAFELQNGCAKGASIVDKSMYFRLINAIEAKKIICNNRQKALLTEINQKLPTYSSVKKIVARQLKIRD